MKSLKTGQINDLFVRKNFPPQCEDKNITVNNKWPKVGALKMWTSLRTRACMDIKTEKEFLAHRFLVLREWIRQNEEYTRKYASRLNRVIKALILEKHLSAEEINYVRHINAIALEKDRALKDLIVNFDKHPQEKVFYVINQVKLRVIEPETGNSHILPQIFDVHLTNKAIVVHDSALILRITFAETLSFKLTADGIYWYCPESDYEFIAQDARALYEHVKRMFFEYLPETEKTRVKL